MTKLTESLDYMDMEDQLSNKMTVDEYAAKMGKDKDIVTLTFVVNSKLAGEDLTSWFERGYDFVLDASLSEGEIEPGKYLVFVELLRRSKVPARIMLLLSDLETLTGYKPADWIVEVEGEAVPANENALHQAIICNPNEYAELKEVDEEDEDKLNEYRELAGLEPINDKQEEDEFIKNLKSIARI